VVAPATSRVSAELSSTPSDGWTEAVYQRKLDNVAACCARPSTAAGPGIVALCEIEDRRVVADLRSRLGRDDLIDAAGDEAHLEAHDIVLLNARSGSPITPVV
jgi:Endonuclease/Exonuclease/phosphatase family